MKQTTSANAPIRVNVAEAKSQLSRLLREVEHQPVVIQNHGRDVAMLVAATPVSDARRPFADFFQRLEVIKQRLNVRGFNFKPPRAVIRPVNPFAGHE